MKKKAGIMKKESARFLGQAVSVVLRSFSLAAKMGLTLYMGRYLGLADLGVYGLVFGAVMILNGALGVRLDYIVARDIVGRQPLDALGKMRDQTIFMLLNYLLLAFIMKMVALMGTFDVAEDILVYIFVLSTVENLASAVHVNMTSLGRPVLANFLYFIRSSSWVFPVVLLGLAFPDYRNVGVVFKCWILGVTASLVLAVWFWRVLPWRETWDKPIHWGWVKSGLRKSFYIWLGTLGLSAGMYVDRFIVMKFLGIEAVGVATFYLSFIFAILTLVHSGVLSFSYPRLIEMHRQSDTEGFWKEVRQAGLHTAIFAAAVAIGVGFGVPMLGHLLGRPELVSESRALWLMLAGTWIRANTETLYWVLFARHQDKSLWLGNLLFLLPAVGCTAVFVPVFGLEGIGYGAIVASLFLLVWRGWSVLRPPVQAR